MPNHSSLPRIQKVTISPRLHTPRPLPPQSSRTLQRRQDPHDARPRAQFDHFLASEIHILTFEIVTQAQSLWEKKEKKRLSRGWLHMGEGESGVWTSRGPWARATPHRVPHARCHPQAGPEVLRDAQDVSTETEPALLRVRVGEEPDLPREHGFGL